MFINHVSSVRTRKPIGIIRRFDYCLIRYDWIPYNGIPTGSDLDTRTRIVHPIVTDEVGWARQRIVLDALAWAGDNTNATGFECVLVDMKSLALRYPTESISVQCAAFWYSYPSSGKFRIMFESYLGGEMIQVGTNFENSGGTMVQQLVLDVQTLSKDRAGVPLARLDYDPSQAYGDFYLL